jgi:putative Mn2+ efflux pump MntP
MIMICNIALILIAAGVAADNLVLAFVSGNGMAVFKSARMEAPKTKVKSPHWFLILGLLFIIQNMIMFYGKWFGGFTKGMLKGEEQLIAIGLLFSMSIRMLQELKTKNNAAKQVALDTRHFLEIGLGTSIYVFAFGCALNWLNLNHRLIMLALLSLIILFLITGTLLGKYHLEKIFKCLNTIAAFLVMAGSLLLMIELLKNNIK